MLVNVCQMNLKKIEDRLKKWKLGQRIALRVKTEKSNIVGNRNSTGKQKTSIQVDEVAEW